MVYVSSCAAIWSSLSAPTLGVKSVGLMVLSAVVVFVFCCALLRVPQRHYVIFRRKAFNHKRPWSEEVCARVGVRVGTVGNEFVHGNQVTEWPYKGSPYARARQ
jgi:hypothetical protein